MKNKILVVLPDGVGIRNYLYSDVFKHTESDLLLFHNFNSETIETIGENVAFGAEFTIPDYKETAKEKFLRELICLSRLKYNARLVDNPTILSTFKHSHKKLANRIFYRAVAMASHTIARYENILALEKSYSKAIRQNPFYAQVYSMLANLKPDRVFCVHQRGLKMPTIFAAASDLGIPTTTVVYSWDNLPKARMALRSNQYLVWSDHMKQEMALYYPEIKPDQVIVTGTPQFEFYADPKNLIEKSIFFEKYGLDLNKKIICFSGDDVKTSPDDPQYLADLAQAILDTGLENQYQILFRRCPVDTSDRFDAVLKRFGEFIKTAPPVWHIVKSAGWAAVYPSYEDVKLLASTAFYADVVFNVGSTMAFDFAMYGKPCVFINYDQPFKVNPELKINSIYNYQHFRSMEDKKAVLWLNSKLEIVPVVESALAMTQNPAMDAWKAKVLGDYRNASRNISNVLHAKIR